MSKRRLRNEAGLRGNGEYGQIFGVSGSRVASPLVSVNDAERLRTDPTGGATGSLPASVSVCPMVLGTGGSAEGGPVPPGGRARETQAASTSRYGAPLLGKEGLGEV